MADEEAPVSLAQHSFTAGEVAPGLYGRQDLQKYHSGCAVMRNWFVDVKGGASVRPGNQYMGGYGSAGFGRLIPFQFSPTIGQTYILAFSNLKLRFIKNPGTAAYPNSSNAGLILSAGIPYEVTTPYLEADLRNLHYLQIKDTMWITCRGYTRKKLQRMSDTNWTLTDVSTSPVIGGTTLTAITISAASGGAPPLETRYMYTVSAVDADGNEGFPCQPLVSANGINIGATQGTVTLFWTAVAGAAYYKVYKALPAHGNKVPAAHEQFGFAGYSYGTTFTDSNIVADFAHAPLQQNDPFLPGAFTGYTITAAGANYPVGGTTISVVDGTGTGAIIYPILDTNTAGAVGTIIGLYIANPGQNYTAPTVTAVGGAGAGFAVTMSIGPTTGITPSTVGLIQQRLVYASTDNNPNTLFAGRPGRLDDQRITNPPVDNDAFAFSIFDQQVTRIYWLRAMPGGLLIGTDAGVIQLTGGSSSPSNPVAITPTNAVIVPQSNYGCADVPPIVIDYNVLFVQKEGIARDLQYNFFANIYTGTDLTVLSSHLFEGIRILDWAYQDTPNKIVWAVLDNGQLLSLTYLKAQEVMGWARHDTNGIYEAVAVVQEGEVNAIYFSINRGGTRFIERQTQQLYFQDSDAWQLDAALSIQSNYPAANLQLAAASGTNILATADAAVFASGDVGKVINAVASRATIITFVSTTQVRVNIDPLRPFGTFAGSSVVLTLQKDLWRMDPVISTVTGLSYLNGYQVFALVDGAKQGPFTVVAGSITLTTPGSQVVVGLSYQAQLQPLYIDVPGEATVQGKLKKIAAASIRTRNAKGLKYGSSFNDLKEWVEGVSSTDSPPPLPYKAVGLYTGDQRLWLDQIFNVGGWVCIQQDDPYPATVLMVVPEMAQGDTM